MTLPTAIGETCGLRWAKNDQICGRPAAGTVVGGCVHEHIAETFVCAQHLYEVLIRKTNCRRCWFGPDPHRCPVLAREVTHES